MKKNLSKSHPFVWLISKVCINYYSLTKIWGLKIFDSEMTSHKNLHGNGFSLFVFVKPKNHWNMSFHGNYKIYCCILLSWKSKLLQRPFLNNRSSNMVSQFLRFFTFSCLYSIFVKNFMKKSSFFNMNFWNLFQDLLFGKFYLLQLATTKMAAFLI